MEFFTTTANPARRAVDCLIVGVFDRKRLTAAATAVDEASDGLITRLLKDGDISSAVGKCTVLVAVEGVRARRVAVVGLGKFSACTQDTCVKSIDSALQALTGSKTRSVLSGLSLDDVGSTGAYYQARLTVQAVGNANYRFDRLKSDRKQPKSNIGKVGFCVDGRAAANAARRGAEHGAGIAGGMELTRDLANLPPNVCTPSYLASAARKLANRHKRLTTKVLNEADMKRLGMHSLLSVSAGSDQPAKLIVMTYKGGGGDAPIVLVGKGVTFDSGGISLKPGAGMDEMKFDMGGAAGVIGTMAAVASIGLDINLTVVVPAVENMPGGGATRPGDIVTSMSGQTIEILNTDAEGRLILCDALTYSRRFKPQTIIDVATLTGACVIALGNHRTGVMSNDDTLAKEIVDGGEHAGDRGWQLPLGDEYAEQLKSNFADMANVGGRPGGTITAGCFLGKFTEGLNWAHLDIAGTAWLGGNKKGATGRPVPMLTELLLGRAGQLP